MLDYKEFNRGKIWLEFVIDALDSSSGTEVVPNLHRAFRMMSVCYEEGKDFKKAFRCAEIALEVSKTSTIHE